MSMMVVSKAVGKRSGWRIRERDLEAFLETYNDLAA
jgi:hypothetical protein